MWRRVGLQAERQRREKASAPPTSARQRSAQQHLAIHTDGVNLEHVLCQIDYNGDNILLHWLAPPDEALRPNYRTATLVRGRQPHQVSA